jgi:hypothetical protein
MPQGPPRTRVGLVAAVAVLTVLAGCSGGLAAPTAGGSGLAFEDATKGSGFAYHASFSNAVTTGGNVYVGDVNGDHRPDLLALGGTPKRTDLGWEGKRPGIFLNNGSGFTWAKAIPSDVAEEGTYVGALFFDRDTDGLPDLLLLRRMGTPVYLHNEGGSFEVKDVGFDEELTVPLGATAADYDGDGNVDLFVYQNGNWQNTTPVGYNEPNGSITDDNGQPNLLYRGTEDGFERVEDAGIRGTRWTLGASFVDLTGDGRPDIHVTNDYNNDYVYVNEGDGTFEQMETGAATNRNGMSSEVFDANRDGQVDVFVSNIYMNTSRFQNDYSSRYVNYILGKRVKGNNLLVNRGDGQFEDRGPAYNVVKGGWGWAASAEDFDNDGDRDLIHATKAFGAGFLQRAYGGEDVPPYLKYPAVFEGTDDGERFEPRNGSRVGFGATDGRGLATLDYDRDGDQDVAIGVWTSTRYQLYENAQSGGHWLQVDVAHPDDGTALGARVYVTIDGETTMQVRNAKADYQSQDSRVLHFGLGDEETVEKLRVVWPDGTEQVWTDVAADRLVVASPDGLREPTIGNASAA